MKIFVRHLLLLLAVVLACQAGIVRAESYYNVSGDKSEAAGARGDQKAAAISQPPCIENSICSQKCACDNGCDCCCCEPCRDWYVDTESSEMFGYTSYQFGRFSPLTGPYAPMSKLDYSLDSTWDGLRVGVQRCNWDVHFEWLTPMVQHIDGGMKDYDWNIDTPKTTPTVSIAYRIPRTRWNDGQKLELEVDYKYSECILGMPIEVWPLAGFRFQRFDITAYERINSIPPDRTVRFSGRHSYDQPTILHRLYRFSASQNDRAGMPAADQLGISIRLGRNCRLHGRSPFDTTDIPGFSTVESTGGDALHLALRGDIPLNCHLGTWLTGRLLSNSHYRLDNAILKWSPLS